MKGAAHMPDLTALHRAFRHDLDTAMASLERLGMDPGRITVASAGPGWPAGAVLEQSPAPGATLTPRTRVVLRVAGPGGFDLLPYPLRDTDADGFGVDRLMALFDDPLHKLALHVRRAGGFLALHPGDPATALRWIELFGLSPHPFPRDCWYALARLLPVLHRVAGTAGAVELACRVVLGLPVAAVRTLPGVVPLPPGGATRLGRAASRLGVDAVAGAGLPEPYRVEVEFGPLELPAWRAHRAPEQRRLRDALYRLVLPCTLHARVEERWRVGSADRPAVLGDPAHEPLLGVNARLGAAPVPASPDPSPRRAA